MNFAVRPLCILLAPCLLDRQAKECGIEDDDTVVIHDSEDGEHV